ncbi:peptidase M22 glycoprotease [Ramaria rubella]|nr:peptidase M22 glycoprotease [Ramaria rubella]
MNLNRLRRSFTVLALESSADDTCAAIVTSRREILSNVVMRQDDKLGGIHPREAIACHQPGAIRRALSEAQLSIMDVDGIAFTRGPGIGGCLSVTSNAAKGLAAALEKPLVGVHHMQAHALTPFLSLPVAEAPIFPFLSLLVSGGHTLLLLAESSTQFKILATTLDSSIGNSYDKVSKLLALPWGSRGPGAALEEFCLDHPQTNHSKTLEPTSVPPEFTENVISFPKPRPGELMFSYSGLYSAVRRYIEAVPSGELTFEHQAQIAWAFQHAAVDQLKEKVRLGLKWCSHRGIAVRHLVVSGGVASNELLRDGLRSCVIQSDAHLPNTISVVFPPIALCTDNAAMIAWTAMDRFKRNDHDPYEIELRPSWSIEDLHL